MSTANDITSITNLITAIPDFPKPGITFRDISPLLADSVQREKAFDLLASHYKDAGIEAVAGLDARGFIFATALAARLACKLVMIRKPSKLPNVIEVSYTLEYGTNTVQIQRDSVKGLKVLVIDDLLATGGTAIAAAQLIAKDGGKTVGIACLIELDGLGGRQNIEKHVGCEVFCPITFSNPPPVPVVQPVPQKLYRPLKPIPSVRDDRVVVFSYPTMDGIADSICSTYSKQFRRGVIQWDKFPDGYFNIQFEHMDELESRHVVFLGSLYDPGKLLEQLSMTLVLPRQFIQSLNILFPYFGPATMERVEEEGTVATAETTARIISSCLPQTRSGTPILRIFDIHALPIRFYFTDNVAMKMMSMVPQLVSRLRNQNITIAFPDEGAFKRFKKQFESFPTVICAKIRDGNKRIIKITDRLHWPVNDEHLMDHVLIVDDLVQSGGTLDECRKALHGLGAKKVSAFVVHAVFPNDGYKRFLKGGDREGFENFFVTNTIPEVAEKLRGKAPFTVLDINNVVAESVLNQLRIPSEQTPAAVRTVYVGSGKQSKLEAARRAFHKIGASNDVTKVIAIPVKSNVDEQPLGTSITEQGGSNRLASLIQQAPSSDENTYYVSLENGLIQKGDKWEDICFVSVARASNPTNVQTVWSDSVEFPSVEHPEILQKILDQKGSVTGGSLLEEKLGIATDTWHEVVAGIDRVSLMQSALEAAINKL